MANYTVDFRAMGCHIQAWLTADSAGAAQILGRVPAMFESWEAMFSRFRPESELSRLNRSAGDWVEVSAPLFGVITLALLGAEATEGLFNPLVLPALQAAGYDHSFEPEGFVPGQKKAPVWVADYRDMKLNASASSVFLPKGAMIDLGGIAKGWAAQQTANILAAFGPCLVDAGGDMAAHGSPDNSGGWLVRVENPFDPMQAESILLTDNAIATSGTDYRNRTRDGQKLHHIIDPRTGRPATSDVYTATVIAPNTVQAELWAKVAVISGQTTDFPTLIYRNDGSSQENGGFQCEIQKLKNQ
jgi:thiamine biosynthesis lipoprotein